MRGWRESALCKKDVRFLNLKEEDDYNSRALIKEDHKSEASLRWYTGRKRLSWATELDLVSKNGEDKKV